MGQFLSGILGTNSQVGVNQNDPFTNLSPWLTRNNQLADILQGQAAGTSGPNPAQQQLVQNAQMMAQQQAQQNAQNRALNPGLAARMSGQNAAQMGGQAAANAGIQQGQQQLASQQLLSGLIGNQQHNLNQASGINAQVASGNQQASQAIVGGIMSGAGAAMGMAHGGMVRKMSDGGMADDSDPSTPQSGVGRFLSGMGTDMGQQQNGQQKPPTNGFSQFGGGIGKMLTSQMPALIAGAAPALAHGGRVMKSGGNVPGKAKMKGDSPKNDTVKAMLSPGEIVIPRSVTESKDAPKKAAEFVAAVLAKKGRMK